MRKETLMQMALYGGIPCSWRPGNSAPLADLVLLSLSLSLEGFHLHTPMTGSTAMLLSDDSTCVEAPD